MTPTAQAPAYEDKHFDKVINVEIEANATLLNQPAALDKDADFFWLGTDIGYTGLPFGIRFTDSTWYQMSDDYEGAFAYQAAYVGVGVPDRMDAVFFPAGSAILFDVQEQSGNPQSFQIVFTGIKRYYKGQ
jgi:hypothetical protein